MDDDDARFYGSLGLRGNDRYPDGRRRLQGDFAARDPARAVERGPVPEGRGAAQILRIQLF